jgi:poly(3-hydroxyoctanoate) depolymerase
MAALSRTLLTDAAATMGSGVDWDPAFVSAAGLRLRVGRRGAGRPLLLITGIGAHLDMWAPFARLVDDRELIAFDPPGAGLSQRPHHALRMQGLAQIVRELLDALGLERVDVLGYSFGGALAQELARRAPNRVRRLVLCATGPGLGGTPPRPLAALMLATPATGASQIRRGGPAGCSVGCCRPTWPWVRRWTA